MHVFSVETNGYRVHILADASVVHFSECCVSFLAPLVLSPNFSFIESLWETTYYSFCNILCSMKTSVAISITLIIKLSLFIEAYVFIL